MCFYSSIPNKKISGLSKLEAFVDDNFIEAPSNDAASLDRVEIIVGNVFKSLS